MMSSPLQQSLLDGNDLADKQVTRLFVSDGTTSIVLPGGPSIKWNFPTIPHFDGRGDPLILVISYKEQ